MVARDRDPVAISADEQQALAQLDAMLERSAAQSLCIVGQGHERVPLPETVGRLLRQLVHQLAQGYAVTLVPAERLLTTQEAADILNVSRPYLVRLLDRGEIPFTRVGTHRRIHLDELLAYKQQRDTRRRAALRELTQMSQEMGLYDASISTETR
jgi:excisionase family DNA binding protein